MDPLRRAAIQLPEASNSLVMRLAIVCVGVLLPLSLNSFIQGRYLIGALSLPVVALFALNVHCIVNRGHYYTKATNLLLTPLTLLMLAACTIELGLSGTLWSFPVALSYYLLLPERNAWFSSSVLVVVVTALAYMAIDLTIATRLFATLATVTATVAFLVHVIAEQQQKLRIQAITDPLTGAFNANLLEPALSNAILQSNRHRSDMSLIALDVVAPDTQNNPGIAAGSDSVLKHVAHVVKAKCRDADRLFRLQGKEFVLLLHNASPDYAQKLADEIATDLQRSEFLENTASACHFGVSTLATSDGWREWMTRGLANLGQAKASSHKKAAA